MGKTAILIFIGFNPACSERSLVLRDLDRPSPSAPRNGFELVSFHVVDEFFSRFRNAIGTQLRSPFKPKQPSYSTNIKRKAAEEKNSRRRLGSKPTYENPRLQPCNSLSTAKKEAEGPLQRQRRKNFAKAEATM